MYIYIYFFIGIFLTIAAIIYKFVFSSDPTLKEENCDIPNWFVLLLIILMVTLFWPLVIFPSVFAIIMEIKEKRKNISVSPSLIMSREETADSSLGCPSGAVLTWNEMLEDEKISSEKKTNRFEMMDI